MVALHLIDRELAAPDAGDAVLVARQPILDKRETLCGYELLYRPLLAAGTIEDPEAATARVIVAALADIGLERLVGDQMAYINVTRRLLLDVRELPIPPDRIVLELVEDQPVDEPLLEVLRELAGAGFRIALDDFALAPESEPLLELASVIKLDIRALGEAALAQHVERLRKRGPALLAEKVETRREYELCQSLGFDLFQGYYFATPHLIRGTGTPTHRLGTIASLVQAGPVWTFEDLERIITQDAGLSHRFLRVANSAFIGARSRVGSIRQALVRLGAVSVRRWLLLLMLSRTSDHPHNLLAVGLQRARLCELLAHQYPAPNPERAFTAGLLSVLDALLDRPMDELLEELPIDERLRSALLEHQGPEGCLLDAVLAYERGRFDAFATHPVRLLNVARAYREALEWADETTALVC